MKKLLTLFFLLLSQTAIVAAQSTVTGTIKDADGTNLTGVTVAEKGTNNGSYTDINGNYSIKVNGPQSILSYSYIGYAPQEILVGSLSKIDVILNDAATELAAVEVVGSRSLNRSITSTPVPVDYIDLKKVANDMGQLDLNQLLQYLAPSFNANRQSGADGADHIDPATLRGLGPDQTLVLINGKRRHQSSLINIYGTRGRGNTGTDLDAIPVAAIDHIEILRDGASAQYGSDAIAGVINIVLKESTGEFTGNVNAGTNIAKYSFDDNTFDGNNLEVNGNYGFKIGERGFVNVSADYLFRGRTNRANTLELFPESGGVRDYYGQAQGTNFGTVVNLQIPFSDHATFYAFGGYNFRNTDAYAFTRAADEARNVKSIYPNGFNPHILSKIVDKSITAGIRGTLHNWNIDFSNTFGSNKFHFYGDSTLNASMLDNSPQMFDDGGTLLSMNSTNLDFTRFYDQVMDGFNVAFGGEYRIENYQIFAGQEESWQTYGPVIFSIDSIFEDGFFVGLDTSYRPGGAQGFPGFRPVNEVNQFRTNIAAYIDVELDLTKSFLLSAAVRAENYSDFGNTINGKLAARYAFTRSFAIRGSVSTGFRAPSLAQIYYNQIFTNVQAGQIFDAVLANNTSSITRALGIPSLTEEKALNGSLGLTFQPANGFSVTIDGYYVKIDDRIVLTGNFYNDDPIIGPTLDLLNVTAAQFFTNAVDTRTLGLDIVLNYALYLGSGDRLAFSYVGNINHMEVTAVHTNELLAGKEDSYFGPRDSAFLVASAPPSKMSLGVSYKHNRFTVDVHVNEFGGLKFYDYDPKPYYYKTKFTVDLTLGYNITKNVSLNIGAVNLLNTYPDPYDPFQTESGGAWDAVQMGFDGTFLFAKFGFRF